MLQTLDSFKQYTSEISSAQTSGQVHDVIDKRTLILENLPLVIHIARRYLGKSNLSLLDLVQEGNVGLIEAAERYQPEGGPFSHYGGKYIEGYILRAIIKESTLLSVSVNKIQLARRIQKLQHEKEGITFVQIAEHLGVPVKSILQVMSLRLDVASLNMPLREDEDETSLADMLEADQEHSDPEAITMNQFTHTSIQQLLAMLTRDERKVIALRYGLDGEEECSSTTEIATRLRKSRDNITGIEERAMLKLQRYASLFHLRESVA